MKGPRILYVEWIDACASNGWEDLENTDLEGFKCFSVGYFIGQTKDTITLAGTIDHDYAQTNARMTIPKAWIRKRKFLTRG